MRSLELTESACDDANDKSEDVLGVFERLVAFELQGWIVGVVSIICYCVAVFFSAMAPLSMCATVLMIVFAATSVLLEVYFIAMGEVDRASQHHTMPTQRDVWMNTVSLVLRDSGRIMRGLLTTVVPLIMGTFEGVAFLFQVQSTPFAAGCSVANLTNIDRQGHLVFSCHDGHVATHMQQSVRTWHDDSYYTLLEANQSYSEHRIQKMLHQARYAERAERNGAAAVKAPVQSKSVLAAGPARRLPVMGARRFELPREETEGEIDQVAEPERMRGYVAPIYTEPCRVICTPGLDSLPPENDIRPCCVDIAPVAWAVSAGQPILPSSCGSFWKTRRELFPEGTCGIFALPLKDKWSWFTAPSRFGRSWGYNITHFHALDMAHAVAVLKALHGEGLRLAPDPFGEDALPYVIAQPVDVFFGTAYPISFVCLTLIFLGVFDRCLNLTEQMRMGAQEPPPEDELVDDDAADASPRESFIRHNKEDEHGQELSLFATAGGFIRHGTSTLHEELMPHFRLPSKKPPADDAKGDIH